MFWSRKYCRDIYSFSTKASLNRNVTAVGRAVTLLSGAGNFSEFVNYRSSLDKSFNEAGVCLELLCGFRITIQDSDHFKRRFKWYLRDNQFPSMRPSNEDQGFQTLLCSSSSSSSAPGSLLLLLVCLLLWQVGCTTILHCICLIALWIHVLHCCPIFPQRISNFFLPTPSWCRQESCPINLWHRPL